MSKRTSILITLVIAAGVLLFAFFNTMRANPVFYKPGSILFPYDPNIANNKLLGGIEARAGTTIIVDVNCYDPDNDPFVVGIMNPPQGMIISGHAHDPNDPNDFSSWQVVWTPTYFQDGLHYVDLMAMDIPPPASTAMTDEGTLIFLIGPQNRAPELRPIRVNMN